jgi:hypothetical protein
MTTWRKIVLLILTKWSFFHFRKDLSASTHESSHQRGMDSPRFILSLADRNGTSDFYAYILRESRMRHSEIPIDSVVFYKGMNLNSGLSQQGSAIARKSLRADIRSLMNKRISATRLLVLLLLVLASRGLFAQTSFPATNVGATAPSSIVTVPVTSNGTVATVAVYSGGVLSTSLTAPEFSASTTGTSTCAAGSAPGAGSTCTLAVTFAPAYPGIRTGAVVLLDAGNNILGAQLINGKGIGSLATFAAGQAPVISGTGHWTLANSAPTTAGAAEYDNPFSVIVDGAGNLYISEQDLHIIRKITAKNGQIVSSSSVITVAGTASSGYAGDGGAATQANLNSPTGLALDAFGNLFIADSENNAIRRVDALTGIITTVAGRGHNLRGYSGDNGAANAAELNNPQGVAFDLQGNLYIVDSGNNCIRMVTAINGQITSASIITTIAGNGTKPAGYAGDNGAANAAELNLPTSVAFDSSGNMYIADTYNNRIRMVAASNGQVSATSTITTFAGTGSGAYTGDGGKATAATLQEPFSVAVDAADNVYIADTTNNVIRKVNSASGYISTYIQSTEEYIQGGNLPPSSYSLKGGTTGIALDGNGDLFLADIKNDYIREMYSNFAVLDFTGTVANPIVIRQGSTSSTISQNITNIGNQPLDLTSIKNDDDGNSALDATVTTCSTTATLKVNGTCKLGAIFAPALTPTLTANTPILAAITVNDYANTGPAIGSNSPLTLYVVGEASPVNSTTTTVTSTPNPSDFGSSSNGNVVFAVTITSGTPNLLGTVTIYDTFGGNTTTLQKSLKVTSTGNTGTANYAVSALAIGLHQISACYVPNTNDAHSASCSTDNSTAPYTQEVDEDTSLSVISSPNPVVFGNGIRLTANVNVLYGGTVTPDGTVSFNLGTTTLCTVTLAANSTQATCDVPAASLAQGNNTFNVIYSGDKAIQVNGTNKSLVVDAQVTAGFTVTASPYTAGYGSPVQFTATVTPNGTAAATGKVSIYDGTTTLDTGSLSTTSNQVTYTTSTLAVGNHTITASYTGDVNNAAATASAPQTLVITTANTVTTLTPPQNVVLAGVATSLSATVQMNPGSLIPTGTVTFTDGSTTLGTAPLSSTGSATLPNLIFTAGDHSIVVTYNGDTNDSSSASTPYDLKVQLATTSTSLNLSAASIAVDGSTQISATVTGNGVAPTGTVSFYSNQTLIQTVALSNNGTASVNYTATAVGSDSITAVYNGDADNAASTSIASTLTVTLIPTTTSLGLASTNASTPQTILVATVLNSNASSVYPAPTGTVTFTSGTNVLGTETLSSGGLATLTPSLVSGSYTIVATYSGDALHQSSSFTLSNVSGTADYAITLTPSALTMQASQNSTLTITVNSSNNYTDTLVAGCSALPADVSCIFNKTSAVLPAGGSQSFLLTIDTNNPLGGGGTALRRGPQPRNPILLAGLFAPLAALFGLMITRQRRRHGVLYSLLIGAFLLASSVLLNGCSGISYSSATPGTYQIEVTVDGVSTGVSHFQTLTLTITK